MDARSFIACLLGASAAAAQTLQPFPPVDPSLSPRAAQEKAQDEVATPSSQLELEAQRPDVATPRDMVGEVTGVDAKRGEVTLDLNGQENRVKVGDATRVELPGRPQTGLQGLVPGDDVRVSLDERGQAGTITLVPRTREESPGQPSKLPRTNQNAPNPSAPEPWNDRPPGDTPGNRVPW